MGRKNELTLVFKDQLEFHVAPGFGSDSDVMEVTVFWEAHGDFRPDLFNSLRLSDINELRQILDTVADFMSKYPQ